MALAEDVEIDIATINDLEKITSFLQPLNAATYPNSRGIKREMFENDTFRSHLQEYLEAKLNNTECNLLFARLKGEVVGTIGFEADPEAKNQAEIWGFYVKSNLQGQGIGRKLWLRLMDKIKLMNFDKLTLTVAKDTPNSLRFYEKNGFKLSGEIEKDWPSWTKEHLLNQYWLMQKDI